VGPRLDGPATSQYAPVDNFSQPGHNAVSGLSLTDQFDQATAAVEARGWTVAHHAQDAGLSGTTGRKRPGLDEAVAKLDAGQADVLVAAKLDRLSRSTVDFGRLIERSDKGGWTIVVLDADVDTTTASGRLFVRILVDMAQYESERIGERVAASHRVRRAQGKRTTPAPELPTEVRVRIVDAVAGGQSLRSLASQLNAEAVATARGGTWHASTVKHVVQSVERERELTAMKGA
jgi:DNA invertase Pin-like site-specific DNA recombinase